MGLLDKLKAAKNFVSGGGAKLALEVGGQVELGAPVPVRVNAQISASMSPQQVYVRVRAQEVVNMTVRDQDDHGDRDRVNQSVTTFDQTFPITGPLELAEGEQHTWEGQFELPPSCQPSYLGKNCRHVWSIQAGLDVRGNDPDSGWTDMIVR